MHTSHFRGRRPQLLLGGAVAALAVSFGAPALASSVSASGARVVASDQSQTGGAITASASNPVITATATPTDSRLEVSSNDVSATARGNQAASSQSPDALDLAAAEPGTWLSTGSFAVEATAPAVIANLQRIQGSPIAAKVTGSRIAATSMQVDTSTIAVGDNRQQAAALANSATNAMSLTGIEGSGGAGIASQQSLGAGSPVTATMSGKAELTAGSVVNSDLGLDGNLQRSIAYGNAVDNALAADAGTIITPSNWELASVVPYTGSAEVSAAYGVLSDQSAQSKVKAAADGGYRLFVGQRVTGSDVSADDNAIIAAGYGNQSKNSASIDAVQIGTEYYDSGAIANVTNVQRAKAGVGAQASGSVQIQLADDLANSRVTADGNAIQAVATANLASGNQLDVHATSIGGTTSGSGDGGHEEGPALRPIGTARLDSGRALTVSAPFSVQNAQTYTGPVSAKVEDSMTRVIADDAFVNSSGSVSGNSVKAASTGNSGANGLTLDAVSLSAAADLNSGQFGEGDVSVKIGSRSDRSGATLFGRGDVDSSSLSVADNAVQGTATANIATNSMSISATQVTNGSGHDDAHAGVGRWGVWAAADYALANHQLLGADRAASVSSDVNGKFAATGGNVLDSALAVEGNSQSSAARGNVASNALSLTAVDLGGDDELAPGTALSSFQAADGNVRATSDLVLDATNSATNSRLSIASNSNAAFAQINGAENAATIDAVRIGELSGDNAVAQVRTGQPGAAVGDHVVANNQMASGSAIASAMTKGGHPGSGGSLVGSVWSATGNATVAQAEANQATNSISVASVADREASAGLLNAQSSDAEVRATAHTDFGYGARAVSSSQVAVDGNATTALARGNSADNSLSVTGGSGASMPTQAMAFLGSNSDASGSAMVLNAQTNSGAVVARAENATYSVALNAGAYQSGIALNGNTVSAAASGNNASNSVALASLDRLPTASLANVQTNSGPVSAQVIGATSRSFPSALGESSLAVTGNILLASATGNVATNAITSAR